MEVNRITACICLLIIIIIGFLLNFFRDNNMLQSILLGIFTGFIVSFVVAVIGYFHEKAKIIEAVNINIKSLFFNLTVISKIFGEILPQIHNSDTIQDLPFKNISGLASLNPEFINNMNLGLYSPFVNIDNQAFICKRLKEFLNVTYNIKNLCSKLEADVVKYNIQVLFIQNNQVKGRMATPSELKNLDELKNNINIFTAKLHEYTTAQAIELDKIANDFFNERKEELSWNKIKANLLLEVENILKENSYD